MTVPPSSEDERCAVFGSEGAEGLDLVETVHGLPLLVCPIHYRHALGVSS